MTRRIWSAALALSMAGGVYLTSVPAQASNMGFKLERDVDYRVNTGGTPLQNIYWVSVPYFNGLGDLANTLATNTNKCVGETGGPLAADGWINVDDVLCDWWQSRITAPGAPAGTFSVTYFKRSDCIPATRNAVFRFGAPNFSGDIFPVDDGDPDPSNNTDLWTDIGYQVNLAAPVGSTPTNRIIVVGSHDPAFAGHSVVATADCAVTGGTPPCCAATAPQRDIVAVPYHTMYRKAVELLCGLEGTDWVDDGRRADGITTAGTAGDARPDHVDECDTSIFDGTNSMASSMFFNDEVTNGVKTCTVALRFGNISWTACPDNQNFDLVPGEGYLLNISQTHATTTTFLSPHF